jgi:hypothetical protein
MVTGCVEVCPLPSSVRSLTLVSTFYVRGSKGGVGLRGIRALAQWRSCTLRVWWDKASLLRVGRGIACSQGVGQAEPVPQGLGMSNLRPRGWASRNLPPRGRARPRSRPLAIRPILIIEEHEFPFFGYPKLGT